MGIYLTKKNATTNKVEKFKVAGNSGYSYPVGSIYMSVNSTSPASMFGGTWEQIKDKFLLSAGNNYSSGSTGGEATHTLTTNEMPAHNHQLRCSTTDYWSGAPHVLTKSAASGNADGEILQGPDIWWSGVGATGGGQAHNNMPPYLAVYCWKRIS